MTNEAGISLDPMLSQFRDICANIEQAEAMYRELVGAHESGEVRRDFHLKQMALYRTAIERGEAQLERARAEIALMREDYGELERVFEERERAREAAVETLRVVRAGIDANLLKKSEVERMFAEKARPETGRVN